MSSRFSEFLSTENIDPRRLLVASRQIERLRPEDRAVRLKKRLGKKSGEAPAPAAEGQEAAPKRRSGRAVTSRLLQAAQAGGSLSGPQKTRLLRALNRVLEQKKKEPVELRKVF
ncbi:MAG TPA: hypothetical protein VNN80_24775 [Polyangiaceae bacterium]|jgi:hypothetical protein|nr:hypothetical protein [Polyangiaceae bacterium]